MKIVWEARATPLPAVAVAASGNAARRLAVRFLTLDDSCRESFTGAAKPDSLFLIGASETLPWTDGVVYLGRDPQAPALLLPTALAPNVSPALLERALRAKFPALNPPLAILPGSGPAPVRVVSLAAARRIDDSELRARFNVTESGGAR